MLKIKKDNVELFVTSGSYENLYKGMGFELVEKTKATVAKTVAPEPIVENKPIENKEKFSKKEK